MKTKLTWVFGLIVTANCAWGDFRQVVASFPPPARYPLALARGADDAHMWVFCNDPPYNIYRINAETGSVYESVASPWGTDTRGLAYAAGGYLYVGDFYADHIYLVHYSNIRSVISSFPAGHYNVAGLALKAMGDGGVGGNSLWSTTVPPLWSDNRIGGARGKPARQHDAWLCGVYLHNRTTGSIISSFPPDLGVVDVAWDWRNDILWGGGAALAGYKPTGSYVGSFWFYRGHSKCHLRGMCYFNQYLWAGATWPEPLILKIHCPLGIGVEPASLGKVKALFR